MDLNLAALLVEPAAFAAGLGVLRLPVAVVRARRIAVVLVLAVVSAVAAATAGASATGWVPLDVVLLAGLGAAAVFAGAHAPSGAILLGGLACAATGTDSLALPLALAAVGLVLVSLLVEAEPLVDAAAGGLVAQAALRLSSPDGEGLTALIAAAVLLLLLVSAVRTLEPRHRRTVVRAVTGALAFSVVGAVAGAAAVATAVGPLRRGLAQATATLEATSSVQLETTAAGLDAAGRDFDRARGTLDAWWTMPARVVPVVAQHWRVLRAAAVTGDELTTSGQRALGAPVLGDVHITEGRVPLEQLAAVEPAVADLAARATAARRRLDDARSTWLVPPLADRLDTHLVRVRDIERSTQLANRVLPTVPRLLGRDGPRRYFLAVQTPVEARAGGGFLGNYGEIMAEDGRLSLTRFGRQDELTQAPGREHRKIEGPADYLARYKRFGPEQTWVNINLSPDFPTDAGVMAELYPQSGGAPIDGVIAVDPAGLAALLHVVGPVQVDAWPEPITSANALKILLFDQYERYTTNDVVQRVDFLGQVAQVAWGRLTGGALPSVPELMATFGPAVRDKHFMLWASRADEQLLFEELGAAGKVAPPVDDFIGLVTQNAGGNKIDYFLRREVDYRAEVDPGSGELRGSVKITLHNDAPASGLGPSLIGNEVIPSLPNGTNKLYLSFYTPWELVGARLDGTPVELERADELGRRVYSTGVVIAPKSSSTVELTLAGERREGGPYRLDVYRQPVVAGDEVRTTLVVPSGWRTPSGGTEEASAMGLESDVTVEVPLRRR